MAYNLEEQESIENFKAWWETWGTPILLAVTAGCLAVAGYNGYTWYKHRETAKASAVYAQLQAAAVNKDDKNVKSLADGITDQYGSTVFGPMGAFVAAKYAMEHGDEATARAKLQWVIDKAGRPEFEAIARVRLAGLMLDEKKYDEALKLVSDFKPASDAETVMIESRRGDIFEAKGDAAGARAAWQRAYSLTREGNAEKNLLKLKIQSLPAEGADAPKASTAA